MTETWRQWRSPRETWIVQKRLEQDWTRLETRTRLERRRLRLEEDSEEDEKTRRRGQDQKDD